jgi:hypothetical protein
MRPTAAQQGPHETGDRTEGGSSAHVARRSASLIGKGYASPALNRLRVRSIDEVGYVAQDGEHLKGLTGSRFGPTWMRYQIPNSHKSTANQGGRAVMS